MQAMTHKLWLPSGFPIILLVVLSFVAGRCSDRLWGGGQGFGMDLVPRTLEDASFLLSVQVQQLHEMGRGAEHKVNASKPNDEQTVGGGEQIANATGPVWEDVGTFESEKAKQLSNAVEEAFEEESEDGSENVDEAATLTTLSHLLFGIGSSANSYPNRKELIRTWWMPSKTRGFVWLDDELEDYDWESEGLPEARVSEDTSHIPYTGSGPRSCLRIARIVVEAYRLGLPDVRWFVMGDDDTVFNPDALAAVLSGYDHTDMLYLGSSSETGWQLVLHGHDMAYGGGGIAISAPLAAALSQNMDECMKRYPEVYGSDGRVRICSAEVGVQLTRVAGFHQFDLRGDASGILQAHPLVPFLSMHHIMLLDPVFPNMKREPALRRFTGHMREDPVNFLQTAFCIDNENLFTAVVSWGYSVKLFLGAGRVGDLERAEGTFQSWHYTTASHEFTFDTRPATGLSPDDDDQCATPVNLWVDTVEAGDGKTIKSTYSRKVPSNQTDCMPHMVARVSKVTVIRDVVPYSPVQNGLSRGPNLRRQCCRSVTVDPSWAKLVIELGDCLSGS